MRKSYLFLLLLPFACAVTGGCTRDPDAAYVPEGRERHRSLDVAEARAFFENRSRRALTRAGGWQKGFGPFAVGYAEPDWAQAQPSANGRIACVDAPVQTDYMFRVLRKHDDGSFGEVRVDGKLLVVKSQRTDSLAAYMRLLVPDEYYALCYDGDLSDLFANCDERVDYSGLELYATLDGAVTAAARYHEGELIEQVFLGDRRLTAGERRWRLARLMRGLYIRRIGSPQTRASDFWDFGGQECFYDSNGTLYYVDYTVAGGAATQDFDGKRGPCVDGKEVKPGDNQQGGTTPEPPDKEDPTPGIGPGLGFGPGDGGGTGGGGGAGSGGGSGNGSGGGIGDYEIRGSGDFEGDLDLGDGDGDGDGDSDGDGKKKEEEEEKQDPDKEDPLTKPFPKDTIKLDRPNPDLPLIRHDIDPLPFNPGGNEDKEDIQKLEPLEPQEIDCDDLVPEAADNSAATSEHFMDISLDPGFPNFLDDANGSPFEHGTTGYRDAAGDFHLMPPYTDQRANSVTAQFWPNVSNMSFCHNHPQKTPCSPGDVQALIQYFQLYSTLRYCYVYTPGTIYVLYIYSTQLAEQFYNSGYFYGINDDFSIIANKLLGQGYSAQDAHLYALAYLLERSQSGVAILSQGTDESHFHQHRAVDRGGEGVAILKIIETFKCK